MTKEVDRKTALDKKEAEKKPEFKVKCKGCGITFSTSDKRKHFHSDTCREEYYKTTYFSKTIVTKRCLNCHKLFNTSMPHKQKFCDDEESNCAVEYRKKLVESARQKVSEREIKFYGDRFKTLETNDFKCSYCGKGIQHGVCLDVEPIGEVTDNTKQEDIKYRTICSDCVKGKDYNKQQGGQQL